MLIDNYLVLSDAQAITTGSTSTYYIDMVAAGTAAGEDLFAQFLVNTAFAGTTTGTFNLILQIAQDTSFATMLEVARRLVGPGVTDLAAGSVHNIQLPVSMMTSGYRYLRANYTCTTQSFSAGKIDARLVKDVDITMDKLL